MLLVWRKLCLTRRYIMQTMSKGTFKLNATTCKSCPVGTYSNTPGRVWDCEKCNGIVSVNRTACSGCPKGTYSLNGECIQCPRGTYSNKEGSTKCILCPFGTVSEKEGSATCHPCSQEDWLPNRNKTMCVRNEFVYKLTENHVYDFSDIYSGITLNSRSMGRYVKVVFCSPKGINNPDCNNQLNVSNVIFFSRFFFL